MATWRTVAGPAVAVTAAAALILGARPGSNPGPAPEPGPPPVAAAWPGASRADLPGLAVVPLAFLDATTAVGTLPTPDSRDLRLVIETGGRQRELRRVPAADGPRFGTVRAAGGHLVWTESPARRPAEIWAAAPGGAARRLTADTGDLLVHGEQHDLVIARDRVHWAAAAGAATEIRSVPLAGGAVRVERVPGEWTLSAWPWLSAAGLRSGSVLRHLRTGREVRVPVAAAESVTCAPAWCRVLVESGAGPVRVDVMRPHGTDRRRIAGADAQPAVADVAVLGRFEILAEGGGLVVHDLAAGRAVRVAGAVENAYVLDGVLWWSTARGVHHTLDLRTV